MSKNLTAEPNTVVVFQNGTLGYTDSMGIVRGRNDQPITNGKIVWVKSRDAPDREIKFQISSESGELIGVHDTLDGAWEACEETNKKWDNSMHYEVSIFYADQDISTKRIN